MKSSPPPLTIPQTSKAMPTKRKKLTLAQRRKRPQRIDPTKTLFLRSPMMKELKRRMQLLKGRLIKLLVDEDALGLTPVINAFCPTGPGGGIDNSCSPGNSSATGDGGSSKPQESRSDKIAAAVRKEAAQVSFSEEVVSDNPSSLSFGDEGPHTRREFEELENALNRDELSEMQAYLDEQRSYALDNIEIDPTYTSEDIAREAGHLQEDVRASMVRMIEASGMGDNPLEVVAGWNPRRGVHGVEALDELHELLAEASDGEVPDVLLNRISAHRDRIKDDLVEAEDRLQSYEREDVEQSFLEDYDDHSDRRDWLRDFWRDNPNRFKNQDAFAVPEMVWAKTSEGGGLLRFSTSSGAEYRIHAEPSTSLGVPSINLTFADEAGDFGVTGAGGAHEVFGRVTAAIAAYVQTKSPELITFTAAEKSRRKLYDRLTKTLARVDTTYAAWTVDKPAARQYIVFKRPLTSKIEEEFRRVAGLGKVATEQVRPLVNQQFYDLEESWFTSEGWDTDDDQDNGLTVNTRWAGQSNPQKVKAFQQWLRDQNNQWLRGTYGSDLRGVPKPSMNQLMDEYIERGMRKGMGSAFDGIKKSKAGREKLDFYKGTREQFLEDTFGRPVAREKVELMAAKSFTDLEGVTDDMDVRMTRALVDGLVQGKGPRDIARQMVKEVDITTTRAQGVAHDALMSVHAEGQLDAMEAMGMDEVGVQVEWSTSGLGVTAKGNLSPCRLCAELEGVVLTISEARGMLPRHRWCKCTFIPANVGEQDETQVRTKRKIESAVRASRSEVGGEDDWAEDLEVDPVRPTRNQLNLAWNAPTDDLRSFSRLMVNAFCPTGEGRGIDNSCGPKTWSYADKLPPHDSWKTLQSEEGYTYHATNKDNARDIQSSALRGFRPHYGTPEQRSWPDGSTTRRIYFTDKPSTAWQFAPSEGEPALLRIRSNRSVKTESTGDRYVEGKRVKPGGIEILTSDGWKRLKGRPPTANAFCPTGPGGGIDNSCPPHRSNIASTGAYSSYPPANPNGRDSLDMYQDKDGNFTPERRKLHNAIIEKQFSGKTEVDQPVAYLMGGGPAAGKSTLVKFLSPPSNRVDVAPDDLLHDLPDYVEKLNARDVKAGDYSYRESSMIGKSICVRAASGKYNILIDGIGNNSVEALQAHATVLRQNGRKVVANYVTADVELAVQRNFERGQRTGRYVPETSIRELHASVSRIVPQAIKAGVFDEFNLWDTGAGGRPLRVASAKGTQLQIHDRTAWERFLAKAKP